MLLVFLLIILMMGIFILSTSTLPTSSLPTSSLSTSTLPTSSLPTDTLSTSTYDELTPSHMKRLKLIPLTITIFNLLKYSFKYANVIYLISVHSIVVLSTIILNLKNVLKLELFASLAPFLYLAPPLGLVLCTEGHTPEEFTDESASSPRKSSNELPSHELPSTQSASSQVRKPETDLGEETHDKFKVFSQLRQERSEILNTINNLEETLKTIHSAKKLDRKLPDAVKDTNRHINDLKEEYPTYFDEESGNTSVQESLDQIKSYVTGETQSLKSEYNDVNGKIKNLIQSSEESQSEKHKLESDLDSSQPLEKKPRGGEDNSSSVGSTPYNDTNPSDTSFHKSSDMKFLDYSHVKFLNILIVVLKAFCGDDSEED